MERRIRPAAFKAALALAAGAAAVVLLWRWIAPTLALVFGAAATAFLLAPLSRWLERFLPRGAAATLSVLAALVCALALVWLLVPLLIRQAIDLAASLPRALEGLRGLYGRLNAFLASAGLGGLSLPALNLGGGVMNLFAGTVNFAGNVADALSQASMAAVLSAFFLIDRERLCLRLELLAPSRFREIAVRMAGAAGREIRTFLRGQATISLAVGALSALGLWLAGVRGALVLGAIVGVFNLIPYFGPLLGAIPAVLAALTDGWQRALLAAAVMVIVQQLDGLLISPRVMGAVTGLSPAAVLVGVFAGGRLGGLAGMLLALPAMMVFRTWIRVFVQRGENI